MLGIYLERDRRNCGEAKMWLQAKVIWRNEWESLGWGEWAWPRGRLSPRGKMGGVKEMEGSVLDRWQ